MAELIYETDATFDSEPEFIIQLLTNFKHLHWISFVSVSEEIGCRNCQIVDQKNHPYALSVVHYKFPSELVQHIKGKNFTGEITLHFDSRFPLGGTNMHINIQIIPKNFWAQWTVKRQLRLKKTVPTWLNDLQQELGEKMPQTKSS